MDRRGDVRLIPLFLRLGSCIINYHVEGGTSMVVELTAEEQAKLAEVQRLEAERKDRDRKAALQKEISRYASKGYRVVSQSEYAAQLVKPKVFSRLWALLWACLALVGILVYLGWYMAKRDKQVYLTVDEDGKVHKK
jgi:hypothetical protein